MNRSKRIAIIGAGPYALSLAAHLREQQAEFRIFGKPMHSWRTQMPRGMLLKSEGDASNLYDPGAQFTLKEFCRGRGITYQDSGLPISLEAFCAYGLEFQQRFVPELEDCLVTRVAQAADGFDLQLDDGQTVTAGAVVVASGVGHYSHIPLRLAHLPREYLSHSSQYGDLTPYRGRNVVVLGGGASALDIAALLAAAGAEVRLMARKSAVEIHTAPTGQPRSLWQRIRNPRTGIGNSLRSWLLVKAPMAFHYLPEATRLRMTRRHLGPAGAWFIRDQVVGKVPMLLGWSGLEASSDAGCVQLRCRSEAGEMMRISTEHVIAATGYRVDLRRLSFLDESLKAAVDTVDRTPVLSSSFESSVPGLYFVGPAAANSFGSVMRFAYGAGFTARRLSAHLGQGARRRLSVDAAALRWRGAS